MSAPKKKKKPAAKAKPKRATSQRDERIEQALKSPPTARKPDEHGVRTIPAMWSVADWPPDVVPFTSERAKRFIRDNLDALDGMGVLTRPGKKLYVFGSKFMKFLETRSARVKGYQSEPNKAKARSLTDFASDGKK